MKVECVCLDRFGLRSGLTQGWPVCVQEERQSDDHRRDRAESGENDFFDLSAHHPTDRVGEHIS